MVHGALRLDASLLPCPTALYDFTLLEARAEWTEDGVFVEGTVLDKISSVLGGGGEKLVTVYLPFAGSGFTIVAEGAGLSLLGIPLLGWQSAIFDDGGCHAE